MTLPAPRPLLRAGGTASHRAGIRRWILAPVSAGLVLVLLLGAVGAGLRVPGLTFLAGLPGLGLLDYRTLSSDAFLPLRAGYVDQLLGTNLGGGSGTGREPSAAASTGTPARDALASRDPASAPGRQPAAPDPLLEHAFTNDDFSRAVSVRRLPFMARTDTSTARREPDEPAGCSGTGGTGGTAWYRFTATDARPLVADTFGSDHALSLAVFDGADLPRLQMRGCDTSPTGDAEVGFVPRAGTTYHFQLTSLVDGGSAVFRLRGLGTLEQVSQGAREFSENNQSRYSAVSADGGVVAYAEFFQLWLLDRRTGERELISRLPDGRAAGGDYPSLSADGRYVSFNSNEPLVSDDTNGVDDLYVHDRRNGTTVRASVSSQEEQGWNGDGEQDGMFGALSADGRYVAFSTPLNGLVEQDDNHESDVFVRDLQTGVTTLESVDESGNPGNAGSGFPSVSRDGRYVTFSSEATNLVEADYSAPATGSLGGRTNVFRRDRSRQVVELVSMAGGRADNLAFRSAASSDGRVIAWTSTSSVLVPEDTNGISDVFVRDMRSEAVERVSVSSRGEQQVDSGVTPSTDQYQLAAGGRYVTISGDGRFIAFDSRAGNLVPQDGNSATDVFLHDRLIASTIRVSVTTFGEEGDGDSFRPRISHDGQVVAFESSAGRFTRSEPLKVDVFVHDRNGT